MVNEYILCDEELAKQAYIEWLCEQVSLDTDINNPEGYLKLAEILYKKEFYTIVPNDENRERDGINLRNYYEEFVGLGVDSSYLSGSCSCLEMMIALAIRMDETTDETSNRWFWVILRNLGLLAYTNRVYFEEPNSAFEIDEILDTMLSRTYSKTGKGSMFPQKKSCQHDMRTTEIWYQMQTYLLKNT